jgi:hypothetical protein
MHLNIRRRTARQKPGFLREDALQPAVTAKNPVSKVKANLLGRFFVSCKLHL